MRGSSAAETSVKDTTILVLPLVAGLAPAEAGAIAGAGATPPQAASTRPHDKLVQSALPTKHLLDETAVFELLHDARLFYAAAVLIADAQAHIWQRVRPGAEAQAHRAKPFGADELLGLMDQAGVDRAVLVPTSWSDDNGNELALKAAQAHPRRFAVFGVLPLTAPDTPERLGSWKSTPGLLGVRASFHTEALAPLLTNGTAEWFWPAAERAGVPVMIYAPHQLREVGRIAERHAGLRLIVDHLGGPRLGPGVSLQDHIDELVRLASLPNVATKASAIPMYSREPFPFEDMHPHVCRAIEAFGPERVFWGSDLTRMRTCSYRQAVEVFTEHLSCLGPPERELVMGKALCDWIGWPL